MEIIDKIKKIKYSRLKPEERFLEDIFCNLKEKVSDNNQNSIFYVLNDEVLFEYGVRNKYFWCHYSKIWKVLRTKYRFSYQEDCELIKGMVWKHLKLKGITPFITYKQTILLVWEYLILKDVIPYYELHTS